MTLPTPDRPIRSQAWADQDDEWNSQAPLKPWTREQVKALVAGDPHVVSPWRVIAVQAAVGILVAVLAGLLSSKWNVFWSALYGAGVVVVPGALLARGMSSALSTMSPGASAVSFMSWELVKVGVSVVMLMLASWVVQPLSWPALLVAAVVCIKVYWLALAWRRRH